MSQNTTDVEEFTWYKTLSSYDTILNIYSEMQISMCSATGSSFTFFFICSYAFHVSYQFVLVKIFKNLKSICTSKGISLIPQTNRLKTNI